MQLSDGWRWQGRQHHDWFGHGTKPREDGVVDRLSDRIDTLASTAIAGLRPEGRRHRAATFDAAARQDLQAAMRG